MSEHPLADHVHPLPERWLPVPGWEELYEISDHGRLRSLPRTVACGPGGRHWRTTRPRILAGWLASDGRTRVTFTRTGQKNISVLVAPLVLKAFVGPRPAGMSCLHANDIRSDDRLLNLRWGTDSENMHDRVRNGIHPMQQRAACPRGHALEQPNLVKSALAKGRRDCLACARARARAQHHRLPFDPAVADQKYAEIMR